MMDVKEIIDRLTDTDNIYFREEEILSINKFLSSKESILHITGPPGTGKTATVKHVLMNCNYLYVNYFTEPAINKILTLNIKKSGTKDSTRKGKKTISSKRVLNKGRSNSSESNPLKTKKIEHDIIVIDEFDKYLEEKKAECLKNVLNLKSSNKKIITISNNLKMGSVRFKPYTAEQIQNIIHKKIDRKNSSLVMDEKCSGYLAKKYQRTGDLRSLFKDIISVLMKRDLAVGPITIKDFLVIEKTGEKSIHHEIITRIKTEIMERNETYRKYLSECTSIDLNPLSKTDFSIIYDIV